MPCKPSRKQKGLRYAREGFTLIESLVYIGVFVVIMTAAVSFILTLTQTRAKVIVAGEVTANARLIQSRLMEAARHAEGINVGASTFGSDPGVLSLDMVAAGVDPTIFSLTADDGVFQINEAGSGAVALTTEQVAITNLVFTNLTGVDDVGIMQVMFTVSGVNNSGSPFFDYEESYQTTLRIPLAN